MRGGWIFGFSRKTQKQGHNIISQEFLPNFNESERPNDDSAVSEQDVVLLTVVGSPSCVRETILTLYRLGFAEVGDWSLVQRAANPKQVMSVLIRRKRDRLKDSPRRTGGQKPGFLWKILGCDPQKRPKTWFLKVTSAFLNIQNRLFIHC